MDEIKMKEKLESLLKDFDFSPKYQVDVMGQKIDVPVKYSNTRAFMVFLPISIKKATELISNKRFNPVSILKKRCLLGITIFDYIECPVGPYREIALSIPVTLDSKISIPFLPLIFDSFFKKSGFYTFLLAMNTSIARDHSKIIFGYPTYDKNIEIDIKEKNGYILIDSYEGREKIISLKMKESNNFKIIRKKNNTYFLKDDKIINVELNYAAYEAQSALDNNLSLELGDHNISKIIKNLLVHQKPFRSIYYAKAIEILDSPKEIKIP